MTDMTATSTPGGFRLRLPGFWTSVTALAVILLAIFLILPIFSVFFISFFDAKTGAFGLSNYAEVFTRRFYSVALWNTLLIGVLGMLGACLLGIPLAFARRVIASRDAHSSRPLQFLFSAHRLSSVLMPGSCCSVPTVRLPTFCLLPASHCQRFMEYPASSWSSA